MHMTLTALFNLFLRFEHVPNSAKRGVIHTLHKGNGKERSDPNSYRPITLLPVLYKLFERLLLVRLQVWTADNNIIFPNPQQSGYQKNRSCVSTSFTLLEAIYHQLERHSKVYACFLDTRKAFDTVWHNGLFYKLFNFGIKSKMWRLMKNCYEENESCVVDNTLASRWFPIRQGVRQGGILSAWLYLLFINEQLDELDHLNEGIKIDGIKCGSPCHADDLALLSLAKFGLDQMMETSNRYSNKWRYDYNTGKSLVMVFGETACQFKRLKLTRKWALGTNAVDETTKYVHLGLLINKYLMTKNRSIQTAQKLKSSLMSLLGPGIQPQGFNPVTSHKLYKLICIPRALYGSELWCDLTASEYLMLERAHRYSLKRLQGFHRLTRTAVTLAMIGSPSFQTYIDRQCMRFLGQLAYMNSDCLPRKVLAKRYESFLSNSDNSDIKSMGYVPHICDILEKYGCENEAENLILNDTFPPKAIWKQCVIEKTLDFENSRFIKECGNENLDRIMRIEKSLDYPSLLWLAAKLDSAQKTRYAFLAKLNTISISETPVICEQCSNTYSDPLVHFFCHCTAFSRHRDLFWERIVDECSVSCSAQLWSFDDMTLSETMVGRQTLDVDFDELVYVLKVAAECWSPSLPL